MADRLSALDTSFLHLEDATTPMHVGSVMVFDAPDGGFDYESLVTADQRADRPRAALPAADQGGPRRPRQPRLGRRPHFDMSYHVRRSALPRPGTDEQLEELVARIQPRPLDRSRPLWEVYLVEGLAEDRFAIITKTHHSLVDGITAVDIGNVLVDGNPTASEGVLTTWRARARAERRSSWSSRRGRRGRAHARARWSTPSSAGVSRRGQDGRQGGVRRR